MTLLLKPPVWLLAVLALNAGAFGAAAASFAADGAGARLTLDAARTVRARGCSGHRGTRAPLHVSALLDTAAAQWSRGLRLKAAIAASGYRDNQSAAIHVSGSGLALNEALAHNLCAALTDARLTDAGSFEQGSDSWLILAAPFAAPSDAAAENIAQLVLQLVNDARAQARRCGPNLMPAAPALRLNAQLSNASRTHALDMLRHNYFDHTGSDGSTPAQRVNATGYQHELVGENIASGPQSAPEAVQGWLSSPGHCQNIMDARFTQMGLGYAASHSGAPRVYWVQDFAEPR